MAREISTIRNMGVIAHIDAGKTTVTERMLFYSGAKHRIGEVDKGTATTDSDAEEQERGITIYSACVTFAWKEIDINLIDTPGHVDFTAEVERCLRVLDGAVVVFSAREGVEAQSETVWRQANKYGVPRVAFINKMDREGASFETVYEEIRSRLDANPVAIQIPVGEGPPHVNNPFRAVIDLIHMKMLVFDPDTEGKQYTAEEIPESLQDSALLWRDAMLERLYDYSNELMELALQEEPIPAALICSVLRNATLHLQIQPLLCGSALHNIGVQPLLDAVAAYLPNPLERPPVEGTSPYVKQRPSKEKGKKRGEKAEPTGEGRSERRKPDLQEPFCGLVFKVLPAKTGDTAWVRVYSGTLKANSRVLNPGRESKDNVSQLWQIFVTRKEKEGQIEQVGAGDIVGVVGLRHSITGDTLCDPKHPILLESIQFPETVISIAIEPETAVQRMKLADVLTMLQRQDPTLGVVSGDTGQTLIRGMGELHLEVVKNRLLRDFNLDVKFHKPQVSYRETIERKVEVSGRCHRQVGGQTLDATVDLRFEPAPEGGAVQVVDNLPDEEGLPESMRTVIVEELEARAEGGGLIAGFPLMKLKVTVIAAAGPEENLDERAFRIAVNEAFEQGLEGGGRVLLEPIMKLDITTPQEYLGDFVGDLQQRRAIIARTDARGTMTTIEAHAPLKELFGYSSAMRSLSQGRASVSMEPLHYAPAPADVRRDVEF